LITQTILGEEYRSLGFSLCSWYAFLVCMISIPDSYTPNMHM
jgi:hypothetical protein